MKKLIIVTAALAVGVAVNAASIAWGGYVANENDSGEVAQEGTVFNLIYLGSTDLSGELSGLTYDTNTGLLGTGSGDGFTATAGQTLVGTHTLTDTEATNYGFVDTFERADADGGVNGNYLLVMFDSTTPDSYWAGQYSVSGISDMTTAGSIEDYSWSIGYGTVGSVTDSSGSGGGGGGGGGSGGTGGVPEPTSGLLLLVGGSILALRRKQK